MNQNIVNVHACYAADVDYPISYPPVEYDRAAVVAAHYAGLVSEGEAAKILGIGRLEFREICDELRNHGEDLKKKLLGGKK